MYGDSEIGKKILEVETSEEGEAENLGEGERVMGALGELGDGEAEGGKEEEEMDLEDVEQVTVLSTTTTMDVDQRSSSSVGTHPCAIFQGLDIV